MEQTNEIELTLEEKEKLADYWVKRLQLDDWDIKFNLNASSNQMQADCVGEARLNEVTKQAAILVLTKENFDNGSYAFEFNFERTLVHELLHLKFCLAESDRDNELLNRVVHQLIEDMARALVDKTPCPTFAERDEVTADGEA